MGTRLRAGGQRQDDGQTWTADRHHRGDRAERGGRGALLPRHLLVLDAENPGRRPVRRQEQHPGEADAAGVDQRDEEHRVRRLPSARAAVHADDSRRARHVCLRRGGVATTRAVGPVGPADARPAHEPRRSVVRQLRRLDGSGREGRTAVRQTVAAARRRAQHRRHAARLDEREAVSARSDRQRPALPHRQRQRSGVRIAGVQLGHAADSRSGEERRRPRSRRR